MDNLKAVFEAITPENLRNIPVYNDALNIFIEVLEEHSKTSIQTENFFNHNMSNETKEELVKIYLYDYYSMINKILSNYQIISNFRRENEILRPNLYNFEEETIKIGDMAVLNFFELGGHIISENYNDSRFDDTLASEIEINPIYNKIFKLKKDLLEVTPENFYFNRIFKETKGFYSSMIYVYDIINKYLTPDDERLKLNLKESFGNTYLIGSDGIYVNRLTPEGDVLKISSNSYTEPFTFKIKGSINKTVYQNTVQYLSHPLGFIYDYSQIKLLKLEDYFSLLFSYNNSVVEVRCILGNVERYDKPLLNVVKFNGTLKVVFDDYSYLFQQDNVIKYFSSQGRLLKSYEQSDQCTIYYTYNVSHTSSIKDTLKFKETKTLDLDKYNISDELKHVITYTPKLGLIIGLFYLSDDNKFLKDSNIYNHLLSDDIMLKTFKSLKVKDIVKILEENTFNLKSELDIESIKFSEELKSFKITLHNGEKVIIDEQKNVKIISSNLYDEDVSKQTKDIFSVKIPIFAEDRETLYEDVIVTPKNNLDENFELKDKLKDITKFKLKENFIVNHKLIEKSKHSFNDITIINDAFKSFEKNNLNDKININEKVIYTDKSLFKEIITKEEEIKYSLNTFINENILLNETLKEYSVYKVNDSFKSFESIKTNIFFKLFDNITFKDDVKISEDRRQFENYIINDALNSRILINLSDDVEFIGLNDGISHFTKQKIEFDDKYDKIVFDDNLISSIHNLSDDILLTETLNHSNKMTFGTNEIIGEYIISNDTIIRDSDNYKYYDNFDVSIS